MYFTSNGSADALAIAVIFRRIPRELCTFFWPHHPAVPPLLHLPILWASPCVCCSSQGRQQLRQAFRGPLRLPTPPRPMQRRPPCLHPQHHLTRARRLGTPPSPADPPLPTAQAWEHAARRASNRPPSPATRPWTAALARTTAEASGTKSESAAKLLAGRASAMHGDSPRVTGNVWARIRAESGPVSVGGNRQILTQGTTG